MSLKNRLTLIIISVLVIAMGVLALSSINKVNSVFSLKKLSAISESPIPNLIEKSTKNFVTLQSVLSSSRNVFNTSLLNVFIVLILLSSLTVYLIVTYSLKSLSNLQKKMKNASINSLGEPLVIVKSDPSEIKALTLSFNKMSKKLKDTFLKQQLFLHNAAHEFRTPLTIISTYSQLLKMEMSEDQKQEIEMIMTILENCNHLEETITQVLLLADDKQVKLNDLINVKQLLKNAESEVSTLVKNKKMTIKMNVPSGLFILGNKNLLFIMFKNLIDNSTKYGKNNSEILINVVELNKQVNFTISNKFMNTNNIESHKIFDAFNRGDNANNSIPGQGLGLTIVKQIILQHSGQINLETSDTMVTFTLSLRKRN